MNSNIKEFAAVFLRCVYTLIKEGALRLHLQLNNPFVALENRVTHIYIKVSFSRSESIYWHVLKSFDF